MYGNSAYRPRLTMYLKRLRYPADTLRIPCGYQQGMQGYTTSINRGHMCIHVMMAATQLKPEGHMSVSQV